MKLTKKRFFKQLINTNQQMIWLAEYNIEVGREVVRESIRRVACVEREILSKEKEFAKIQEEEVKKGLMQYHYEKVKNAKQFIKDLHGEIDGEKSNREGARASIAQWKNKLIKAQMQMKEEIAHLNKKGFNLEDEIDKKPKVDDKLKSESK